MSTNSIQATFKRIDAWLEKRMPKEWLEVPGLSEKEICQAEAVLGLRLPDDIRESYKIHNGFPTLEIVSSQNIGHWLPLVQSTKQWVIRNLNVVDSWHFCKRFLDDCSAFDPKGPISKVRWSLSWIPVFDNIQGDYLFMDMKPPRGGTVGQLIDWWRVEGPRRIFAKSFGALLERFADDLTKDRYLVQTDKYNYCATIMKKTYWKRQQALERKWAQEQQDRAMSGPDSSPQQDFVLSEKEQADLMELLESMTRDQSENQ